MKFPESLGKLAAFVIISALLLWINESKPMDIVTTIIIEIPIDITIAFTLQYLEKRKDGKNKKFVLEWLF